MGAVRIRVQTADKNAIHTTPVHQLKTCEVKSWVFIRISYCFLQFKKKKKKKKKKLTHLNKNVTENLMCEDNRKEQYYGLVIWSEAMV